MASSLALVGLTRATANRSVHLRLVPRIETLAESREILRLIQQYGRVEMFRNLKYDSLSTPNTMLAVFETDDAAQELLKASPLRFDMRPEEAGERVLDNQESANHPAPDEEPSEAPYDTQPSPFTSRARHYQLQVNKSTLHHRDAINQHPYNGPFRISYRSEIQEDLAKKVPMAGLSEVNLRKAEKPWRVIGFEKAREDKQRKSLRELFEETSPSQRQSSP